MLPDEMFISEIVRMFSIFMINSSVMYNGWKRQIALAAIKKSTAAISQVHFSLAGKSSGSARSQRVHLPTTTLVPVWTAAANSLSDPNGAGDGSTTVPLICSSQPHSSKLRKIKEAGFWGMERALEQDLWKRPTDANWKISGSAFTRISTSPVSMRQSFYFTTWDYLPIFSLDCPPFADNSPSIQIGLWW